MNQKDTKETEQDGGHASALELRRAPTQEATETRKRADELSNRIIGAAIEVHRMLGPGLLESVYETCLARELVLTGLSCERQRPVPIEYKGERLDAGYRLDLVVDDLVIVEIKAVERLEPIHRAQLLTYLRLTRRWLGLLINVNVPVLNNGIERLVN